jgi:hypothetical protein
MITVMLHFPHAKRKVVLPGVPRKGEDFLWRDGLFTVTAVTWVADPWTAEGPNAVFVDLEPANETARHVMDQERVEDPAKALLAEAKADGRTEQIVLVQAWPQDKDTVPGVDFSVIARQGRHLTFVDDRSTHPEIDQFFEDMAYSPDQPDDVRMFAFPAGEYQVPEDCESDTFDVFAEDASTIREAIAAQGERP